MFCPYCGNQLADNARFCTQCGSSVAHLTPPPAPAPEPVPVMEKPVARPVERVERPVARSVEMVEEPFPTPAEVLDEPVSIPESAMPQYEEESYYDDSYQDSYEDYNDYDYRELPTVEPTGIERFYVLDFLVRMTKNGNVPTLIYLIINVVIIGFVCTAVLELPIVFGIITGLVIYAASVIVALSPIGEGILRMRTGCKPINDPEVIARIEPLFREVYYKAKLAAPHISNDIRLYMNDDDDPNAFATGRKTVCITRGLLHFSDSQIKAILGHEFGHLAHKDTDKVLVVTIGNFIVTAIIVIARVIIEIIHIVTWIIAIILGGSEGLLMGLFVSLYKLLITGVIIGLTKLWTWIGILLVMKSSRANEYDADAFSFDLRFGDGLTSFLRFIAQFEQPKQKGLFAVLSRSHPDSYDRIARLEALDAASYPELEGQN